MSILHTILHSLRFSATGKPLLVITVQKSGTHLLFNYLDKLGLEQLHVKHPGRIRRGDFFWLNFNKYIHTHRPPEKSIFGMIENGDLNVIFNYRDPRDVIVSNYYWILNQSVELGSTPTQIFQKNAYSKFEDKQEAFQFMIKCQKMVPYEQTINDWFISNRGLLHHRGVFKTTFEALVGQQGNGNENTKRTTLIEMVKYLGVVLNSENSIPEGFDPTSRTFRQGQIGGYIREFSKETLDLFMHLHSDLLHEYGYG